MFDWNVNYESYNKDVDEADEDIDDPDLENELVDMLGEGWWTQTTNKRIMLELF